MQRLVLVLSLVMMMPAFAEIYHYTDQSGRRVFVDSLSKVPARYRDQLDIRMVPPAPQAPEQDASALALMELEAALAELETPVQIWGNRVLVPVTVRQGRRAIETRLVLDTGATGTVFHARALKRLRYTARAAGYAEVADGGRVPVQRARLNALQIGPFTLEDAEVVVIDNTSTQARHHGLLGMDFLRAAHYRIDFAGQRLIWFPQRYQALEQQRQQLLQGRTEARP